MPWVSCTVYRCVYNAEGTCNLRDLSVGAAGTEGSRCAVYTPRDRTRIFCELEDCVHNRRRLCILTEVTIACSADGRGTCCQDYTRPRAPRPEVATAKA
jgi:hypothetical protein